MNRDRLGFHLACVLLTAVTGLGHIALGRTRRGLVLFALFAFSANGVFVAAYLWQDAPGEGLTADRILVASALATGLVWGYGWVDIVQRTLLHDAARARRLREEGFRSAVAHYLGGRLDPAREVLRTLLGAEPRDADVLFRLAQVEGAAGRRRAQLRALRRCRRADLEGKWRWEVARSMECLDRRGPAAGPDRPPGA
ncbi:MAG: hypothetical protein HY722_02990 [Planctomycetes bacterium]|nr:hypothetical protein [Planctomycetota bacterium]